MRVGDAPSARPGGGAGTGPVAPVLLRRGLGALLLALTLLPFYLLLEPERTGPFGGALRVAAAVNLESAWWGSLVALVAGTGLALLLSGDRLRSAVTAVAGTLRRPPTAVFAAATGALAGTLGVVANRLVFRGLPSGVDEMSSLFQARYLAQGMLAGPVPPDAAAHVVVNTVLTPEGWVSFYPPAHLLLLAAGLTAGALWLLPLALLGVHGALVSVAFERILGPERRAEARTGALLVALSPFLFLLGGSYLSHVSAAAFLASALVAGLAARDGRAAWGVAAGVAVGLAVTSRPWTGLVVGLGLTGGLWLAEAAGRRRPVGWLVRRLGAAFAGGVPFAVGWFLYNRHFFGDPLTVGYTYAYGPAHGLGFHRDPWGNLYGPAEVVGFTSADLQALGLHLLETPVPAVALVGLWLATARRLPRGAGVLLAWALLPVAANLFYWHHGAHLGPRMLYEGAAAWILLAVLAAVGLVRSLDRRGGRDAAAAPGAGGDGEEGVGTGSGAPGDGPGRWGGGRLAPARVVRHALLACLLVAPFLALSRARAFSWDEEALERFRLPRPPEGPALVFVHGSWAERISGRLQAAGMRMDSVETAVRRNDICALHRYALRRAGTRDAGPGADGSGAGSADLPELDSRHLPGIPRHLRIVELTPGNKIRVDPRTRHTASCRREARADRLGVVALAPLLWRGELPGIEEGRPMIVRDLGPEGNARVLERHPDRTPYVYFKEGAVEPPGLHPYDEGMARLWGRGAGSGSGASRGIRPEGRPGS